MTPFPWFSFTGDVSVRVAPDEIETPLQPPAKPGREPRAVEIDWVESNEVPFLVHSSFTECRFAGAASDATTCESSINRYRRNGSDT